MKVKVIMMMNQLKALKQAFDVLNASHERLEEAHEKLEKAHSSLLDEPCNVGLTCDLIDESFYNPTIVAPTNPSCSTSTSTSSSSDGLTCDSSIMVENEKEGGN